MNKDVVKESPKSFADLTDSKYANAVAMPGDPRTGNSSMMTVYAAGTAKGGKGGAETAKLGTAFMKDLKASGNLVPVNGNAQNMAQGTTPVLFDWDYNVLAMRDKLAGNPPMDVIVPSDAVIAGVYVQAISAFAPHPNAAKLWMEYLYSDEGQVGWLKGYCHPIRFTDMATRKVIPRHCSTRCQRPKAMQRPSSRPSRSSLQPRPSLLPIGPRKWAPSNRIDNLARMPAPAGIRFHYLLQGCCA